MLFSTDLGAHSPKTVRPAEVVPAVPAPAASCAPCATVRVRTACTCVRRRRAPARRAERSAPRAVCCIAHVCAWHTACCIRCAARVQRCTVFVLHARAEGPPAALCRCAERRPRVSRCARQRLSRRASRAAAGISPPPNRVVRLHSRVRIAARLSCVRGRAPAPLALTLALPSRAPSAAAARSPAWRAGRRHGICCV